MTRTWLSLRRLLSIFDEDFLLYHQRLVSGIVPILILHLRHFMFGDGLGRASLVHTCIPAGLLIFKILELQVLDLSLLTIIVSHRVDDQIHKIHKDFTAKLRFVYFHSCS